MLTVTADINGKVVGKIYIHNLAEPKDSKNQDSYEITSTNRLELKDFEGVSFPYWKPTEIKLFKFNRRFNWKCLLLKLLPKLIKLEGKGW